MEVLGHKKKYGYTLVELLVVIALFAIVLSVAMPSFNIIFNTQEKKELMEFKRDIIFARNSAIVENTVYIFSINKSSNSYIIRKEDNKTVVKEVNLSHGIVIGENNFGGSIKFTPTGSPSIGGTISLTNKKKQKIKITITPVTGQVNLYIDNK